VRTFLIDTDTASDDAVALSMAVRRAVVLAEWDWDFEFEQSSPGG
jgi:hypothetical protein